MCKFFRTKEEKTNQSDDMEADAELCSFRTFKTVSRLNRFWRLTRRLWGTVLGNWKPSPIPHSITRTQLDVIGKGKIIGSKKIFRNQALNEIDLRLESIIPSHCWSSLSCRKAIYKVPPKFFCFRPPPLESVSMRSTLSSHLISISSWQAINNS